ncbi:MAG: hypothetical protein ACRCZD_03285 [Phycicoccus sp.]
MDLGGQRVVVIGASSGIGRAICTRAAGLGASVEMVSRFAHVSPPLPRPSTARCERMR